MYLEEHIIDCFKFCAKCKHWEQGETNDICSECLKQPVKEDGRVPVHYEEEIIKI